MRLCATISAVLRLLVERTGTDDGGAADVSQSDGGRRAERRYLSTDNRHAAQNQGTESGSDG